jgi:hypothetical protein
MLHFTPFVARLLHHRYDSSKPIIRWNTFKENFILYYSEN